MAFININLATNKFLSDKQLNPSMNDIVRESIQTYDKYAKFYADFTSEKIFQFQLNKFISFIPRGGKALDAGCGAGRDVGYFDEEGLDVLGIDMSEGLLNEAKERFPESKFEKMDFQKTSFQEESFDGIWCMASLSDVPKKETNKAIKEFKRIIKPDGIIYAATKKGEGEGLIKKQKYGDSPRFYSLFTQEELEKIFINEGFEIISSMTSDDNGTQWVEVFARRK